MYFIKKEINDLNSYVLDGDSYFHLDTLENITCEEYSLMLEKAFDNKDEAIKQFCLSIIEEKARLLTIDNEIARLTELKNKRKRKIESITNIIRNNCDSNIDFDIFKLSFRKGVDSVVIKDENLVPEIYKQEVLSYKINKNNLKKVMKDKDVPGVMLLKGKKSVIIK